MKNNIKFVLTIFLYLVCFPNFAYASTHELWKEYNSIESIDVAKTIIASEPRKLENYHKLADLWEKRQEEGVKIFVDGVLQTLKLDFGIDAIVEGGRILVPLRAIGESMGADVKWDEKSRLVKIHYRGNVIKLSMNATIATVNEKPYILDVPAKMKQNRVMVPLRFISQGFKKQVGFMNVNKKLKVAYVY